MKNEIEELERKLEQQLQDQEANRLIDKKKGPTI
jgi:hypothetical protein